jgi:SpoVK/Ycf46/Vps4 family AAA+-type ATPase
VVLVKEAAERAAALREALAVSPDNAPLRRLLARGLFEAGAAAEAAREWEWLLERDPGDAEARAGRERCREALAVPAEEEEAAAAPRGRVLRLVEGGRQGAARPRPPRLTFADVGGMEELKEELGRRIVDPFRRPELYRAYGRRAGGGMLLFGPPGCGKTYVAQATAGEAGVPIVVVAIEEILDLYVGESEKHLAAIFAEARRLAPAVLFFDEVDALGASRQQARQPHERRLISQLLVELDGAAADNAGVLVLGATNSLWHVDPALRRPGRFDRTIFVPPPDAAARQAILGLALRGKPVGEDLDLGHWARLTEGFSGADLTALVEEATDRAMQEALAGGKVCPLSRRHFAAARETVQPSTTEWFETARRYAKYANEAGTYDPVLAYLSRQSGRPGRRR